MKHTILIVTAILCITAAGASQERITEFNDLDIATALIAKKGDQVKEILNTFDIEYWFTNLDEGYHTIYIQYNNSVRVWGIKIGSIYRSINNKVVMVASDIVEEVRVRYRHNNLNDLKHFYAFEKPQDTDFVKYEKELGKNMSHFKIVQK